MNLNELQTKGGTVSYSAGSSKLDPLSFRIAENSSGKIGAAVTLFPTLGKYFQKTPVLINCYPATLGSFESVIYLDTYLRPVNFSRGLMLAETLNTSCIVLGQPLVVLDLLMQHCAMETSLPVPKQLLFALGGYYAPASMEGAFTQLLKPSVTEHDILHAYGMAEVDFGCLLGTTRNAEGKILYKIASGEVQVELKNGQLFLGKTGETPLHNTDDNAVWDKDSLVISPGNKRLNQEILEHLESWNFPKWERQTGHVARVNGDLVFQLREGLEPNNNSEMEFFNFSRSFKMTWAGKPSWSI